MNVREWALPVYTILMQLATGTLLVLWTIRAANSKRFTAGPMDKILRRPVLVVFITVLIAVIGAHFHLSNPLQSFLAILNLRKSWLSREILFTIMMFIASAALVDQIWKETDQRSMKTTLLGWLAIFLGSASIYCMSSIYLLPTQALWNNSTTILLFFGSAILLGATSASAILVMDAIFTTALEPELKPVRAEVLQQSLGWIAGMGAVGLVFLVIINGLQLTHLKQGDSLEQTSLMLLFSLYRPLFVLRIIALLAGVTVLCSTVYSLKRKGKELSTLVLPFYLACFLTLMAEILGRFLFYATHIRIGL